MGWLPVPFALLRRMALPSVAAGVVSGAVVSVGAVLAQNPDFQYASRAPLSGTAVYDLRRGVVVVFETSSGSRRWHWDGATFREQLPGSGEGAQECTYDGVTGHIYTKSTHGIGRFDGAAWSLSPYPTGISPNGMVYDWARRRLVAKNSNGTAILEWNGSQWATIAALPGGLASISGGTFVYQPVAGEMLLFLPSSATNTTSVWSWNGSAWSLRNNTGPNLLGNPVVAIDPTTGAALLEGRTGSSTEFWSYSAGTWTRAPALPALPGTTGGLVWDGLGFLRLGISPLPTAGLWRFRQGAWQAIPMEQPTARASMAMASSPSRREIVMFGGGGNQVLADTWRYAGGWQQLAPAVAPPGRRLAALAWSESDQVYVLFGGRGATGQTLADTWSWDGGNWTQRVSAVTPPAMILPFLATDPLAGVTLVGEDQLGQTNQHWRWHNGAWQQLGALPFAPSSLRTAFGYDPQRNRCLYVQEELAFEWDGLTWQVLPNAPGNAAGANNPGLAFDPGSQRMLYTNDNYLQAYAWDGTAWQILALAERGPSGPAVQTDFSQGLILSAFHRWSSGSTLFWNGCDAVFTRSPAEVVRIGYGCGLDGAPGLVADGRPRLGDGGFGVVGELRAAAAPGVFAVGFPGPAQALGGGCALWVGQTIATSVGIADPVGRLRVGVPLPNQPALLGVTLAVQTAAFDPARSGFAGWTFSAGLLVALGN